MRQEVQDQSAGQNNNRPFTVAVSILLASLVVAIGIYFWQKSSPVANGLNLQQQITLDGSYKLIGDKCTIDECLFNTSKNTFPYYPVGLAVIKGYYTAVEISAWEETRTCDSFTITSGSTELMQAMVDMVDEGSTVHSKNQLNQPVINLGLAILSPSEKQSILTSSINNQIELIVLRETPKEVGLPVCYPDVIVLRNK